MSRRIKALKLPKRKDRVGRDRDGDTEMSPAVDTEDLDENQDAYLLRLLAEEPSVVSALGRDALLSPGLLKMNGTKGGLEIFSSCDFKIDYEAVMERWRGNSDFQKSPRRLSRGTPSIRIRSLAEFENKKPVQASDVNYAALRLEFFTSLSAAYAELRVGPPEDAEKFLELQRLWLKTTRAEFLPLSVIEQLKDPKMMDTLRGLRPMASWSLVNENMNYVHYTEAVCGPIPPLQQVPGNNKLGLSLQHDFTIPKQYVTNTFAPVVRFYDATGTFGCEESDLPRAFVPEPLLGSQSIDLNPARPDMIGITLHYDKKWTDDFRDAFQFVTKRREAAAAHHLSLLDEMCHRNERQPIHARNDNDVDMVFAWNESDGKDAKSVNADEEIDTRALKRRKVEIESLPFRDGIRDESITNSNSNSTHSTAKQQPTLSTAQRVWQIEAIIQMVMDFRGVEHWHELRGLLTLCHSARRVGLVILQRRLLQLAANQSFLHRKFACWFEHHTATRFVDPERLFFIDTESSDKSRDLQNFLGHNIQTGQSQVLEFAKWLLRWIHLWQPTSAPLFLVCHTTICLGHTEAAWSEGRKFFVVVSTLYPPIAFMDSNVCGMTEHEPKRRSDGRHRADRCTFHPKGTSVYKGPVRDICLNVAPVPLHPVTNLPYPLPTRVLEHLSPQRLQQIMGLQNLAFISPVTSDRPSQQQLTDRVPGVYSNWADNSYRRFRSQGRSDDGKIDMVAGMRTSLFPKDHPYNINNDVEEQYIPAGCSYKPAAVQLPHYDIEDHMVNLLAFAEQDVKCICFGSTKEGHNMHKGKHLQSCIAQAQYMNMATILFSSGRCVAGRDLLDSIALASLSMAVWSRDDWCAYSRKTQAKRLAVYGLAPYIGGFDLRGVLGKRNTGSAVKFVLSDSTKQWENVPDAVYQLPSPPYIKSDVAHVNVMNDINGNLVRVDNYRPVSDMVIQIG